MLISNRIINFSLKEYLRQKWQKRDHPFCIAFFTLLLCLNVIFLYHGAHNLFSAHDWQYMKHGLPTPFGFFTQGEYLPLLTPFIAFTFYSYGIVLLARYWHLPHNKQTYILFSLFAGITPALPSLMYNIAFTIPLLSLPTVVIISFYHIAKHYNLTTKKPLWALLPLLIILALYKLTLPQTINTAYPVLLQHYAYIAILALCLHSPHRLIKNFCITLAVLNLIHTTNQLFETQKFWHITTLAEQKLYKRILKRYEQNPLFNLNNKYTVIYTGNSPFQNKYQPALLPQYGINATNITTFLNYNAPKEYALDNADIIAIRQHPLVQKDLTHIAPYPAKNSTYIGSHWLILTLP